MPDLLETIKKESIYRPKFWKDRDDSMDADALMFLQFDELQDMKGTGFSKFKTNWMQVAVDRTAVMITQNPARFRIPVEDSQREDRDLKTRIERWCRGLWDDIDTRLAEQGWTAGSDMIAAKHLCIRGMCASEVLMKDDEEKRRKSPTKYHWWDPRFVYPFYDGDGLNSVLYCLEARLGDVMLEYEDAPIDSEDADQVVRKYIWYDRKRYGVACEWMPKGQRSSEKQMDWLIQPEEHGLEQIPVVIAYVNQVPLLSVPKSNRANRKLDPNNSGLTKGPRPRVPSPQSLWARSMFAGVREAIPQFNEMMALMQQIVRGGAYGTWFYLTADGAPRFVEIGGGSVNFDQLQTKIQRFSPDQLPQGITEIISAMNREVQTATIPAMLLTAGSGFPSGFDRAQAMNVAMASVFEYQNGHNRWKEMLTQEALRQFVGKDFTMVMRGYDARRTPFAATIHGDEIQQYYAISVQRKPSIPEDMMGRIQAARLATDPANPVLDPWTTQDTIMESEDPDGVIDMMWEWKAMSFPPIQYKALMAALLRRGDPPEWIQTILTQDEVAQMSQMALKLQGMGAISQLQAAMQPTGASPQVMPPEQQNPGAMAMLAGGGSGGAPAAGGPPMMSAAGAPMTPG